MVMVLGIDIGGTGSRALLCADGEIVAESESGSAALADAVRRAVTVALPGAEFHVLTQPPVAGAVHLARRAAGKETAGA